MKISINEKGSINSVKNNRNFKGHPQKLSYGTIKNAQHAIKIFSGKGHWWDNNKENYF